MKKLLSISLVSVLAVTLISWGWAGHKTVATIAYNHLTPKSKDVVKALLGDTSLADVASWADEILSQPAYKSTAPEHYLNLPLGLNYASFEKEVQSQDKDNVYKALLKNEQILKAQMSTKEERAVALKFIVHFIGDLHQPMHISRAEDKGGNTIQVQFDGKGTNLHSLWDSKLIGKEGKTFEKMSIDYDKATPAQVKQWQNDSMMKWLFESYQISSKLYSEVEKNNKLDDAYYNAHISIINERIEKAGIRLAGVLNKIFAEAVYNYPLPAKKAEGSEAAAIVKKDAVKPVVLTIPIEEVAKHIGQTVTVTAQVYGVKDIGSMALVNLGAAYPNQLLTVALKGNAKGLATLLDKQLVTVTGAVIDYKGKPEIVVSEVNQIVTK
jgi:hypothetical protein